MYIPWIWLKKHIIFPENARKQTIVKNLTALGLETEIINENWQFTPLPNRLDLFSWWGIAREINILLNYPLILPIENQSRFNHLVNYQETNWGKIKVNDDECSQIQLVLIQNIKIQTSPAWIKSYLASNNIASINNIIDTANLVMLETGQPLHVYDYDRLPSQEIMVRKALNRENMTNLKEQLMILNDEDIVISAGKEIISLAGIIGSRVAAVNSKTINILIESAFFIPFSIKKTSQRLNFSTQASQYFSKKHNLPFGNYALKRAIELIKEICPSMVVKDVVSWAKNPNQETKIILISHELIKKKIGVELSSKKIEESLKKLQFSFRKE